MSDIPLQLFQNILRNYFENIPRNCINIQENDLKEYDLILIMETKICKLCNVEKHVNEFYVNNIKGYGVIWTWKILYCRM